MISRYEEYFPSQLDAHGRFKAVNSFAYKNGFIEFHDWLNNPKSILFKSSLSSESKKLGFKDILGFEIPSKNLIYKKAVVYYNTENTNYDGLTDKVEKVDSHDNAR